MNEAVVTRPIHRAVKYRAFPKGEVKERIDEHFRATQEIFNTLLLVYQEQKSKSKGDIDPHYFASLASEEAKKYPTINRQAAYYVAPRIIYGAMRAKKQGEGELKPKEVGSVRASFTIRCSKPVFKDISATHNKKRATINLPNIGDLIVVPHREIPENAICRLCTVSRNPAGQYFFSVDYEVYLSAKQASPIKKPVGLDFSVPKLYVASDRTLVPEVGLLKIRKKFAAKVAAAHRKLAKCQNGSKNHEKARQKLAKIYQQMDNIRVDYIHKETARIAANYDFISAETLSLKDMCERFGFYKSVQDDSWYLFVAALRYKAEAAQKQFHFVSRYYPSSKTCHRCGFINHGLKLSDREYVCPACHVKIDRDYNAAKNIRDQALRDAGYRINYIRRPPEAPASPTAPATPAAQPTQPAQSVKTAQPARPAQTGAAPVAPTTFAEKKKLPEAKPFAEAKPSAEEKRPTVTPLQTSPLDQTPNKGNEPSQKLIPVAEKPRAANEGLTAKPSKKNGEAKAKVEAKGKPGRPKGAKNKPKDGSSSAAKKPTAQKRIKLEAEESESKPQE